MFGKPLQTPAATGTSGGKNLFSTPTPANKTGGGGGNGFFGSTPSVPTNATNTTSGLFANAGNTGGAKSDNNNKTNNKTNNNNSKFSDIRGGNGKVDGYGKPKKYLTDLDLYKK